MIQSLSVENIALIEKLQVDLGSGLNILSGETGAGKSIIIDAVSFVLGERADRSLIRYGTDYAVVEAASRDCSLYIQTAKRLQQISRDHGLRKTLPYWFRCWACCN